jgi:predicted CoA-binding protein
MDNKEVAKNIEKNKKDEKGKDGKKEDGKQSNTIIQQINGFSMTPMNDRIAEQTIEDHKYLLELVENKAAIAYFAVANRNQSLFNALRNYYKEEMKNDEAEEGEEDEEATKQKKKKGKKPKTKQAADALFMNNTFVSMIMDYDFMSLVMYPELKKRREFVHDAWMIAKMTENTELKIAISNDPYFYITRDDILVLLKTKDD